MSRHHAQGVVLTGYHSNAELLPQTGLCAASCPSGPDLDTDVLRWETTRGSVVLGVYEQSGQRSLRFMFFLIYILNRSCVNVLT